MAGPNEVDPGETQALRLEQFYDRVAEVTARPEVARRLRDSPGENEWSARQTLGHVVEMIPYWLNECQALIAAAGELPQFGRTLESPERLAGVKRGEASDPDELLLQLRDETLAASNAIRRMSPAEREKKGIHNRRGEMTVAGIIETLILSHAEEHLAQIQESLK